MAKKVEAKLFEMRFENAKKSDNPKEALTELMVDLSCDMFRAGDRMLDIEDCGDDEATDLAAEMQVILGNLRDVTEALKPLCKTE